MNSVDQSTFRRFGFSSFNLNNRALILPVIIYSVFYEYGKRFKLEWVYWYIGHLTISPLCTEPQNFVRPSVVSQDFGGLFLFFTFEYSKSRPMFFSTFLDCSFFLYFYESNKLGGIPNYFSKARKFPKMAVFTSTLLSGNRFLAILQC